MTPVRGNLLWATLLGILAVLIWGTIIAVARSVVEQMGALASGACANLIAGGLACLILAARPGGMKRVLGLPRKYLFGCGLLFVLYNLPFYLAMEWSATREQAIGVAMANYLWPALGLALSVPLLGKRARWTLLPSLLIATAGVFLALAQGGQISLQSFGQTMRTNPWPFLMAATAAFIWALYSNLSRRWAGDTTESGVPLFLLVTGVVLAVIWKTGHTTMDVQLTTRSAWELIYLSLFPTMLAYLFWDIAVRKGNVVLVTSLSFFTPLISTIVSCLYLHVAAGATLWIACGLVIIGAMACKRSLREPIDEEHLSAAKQAVPKMSV